MRTMVTKLCVHVYISQGSVAIHWRWGGKSW